MLRMRLQRRGKRNYATYRVVVAEQSAPIKGRFIDDLGAYNPHTNSFTVDAEKVAKWLKEGVQPSDTVHNLLINNKLIDAPKVTSWKVPTKKKNKPAEAAAEAK